MCTGFSPGLRRGADPFIRRDARFAPSIGETEGAGLIEDFLDTPDVDHPAVGVHSS